MRTFGGFTSALSVLLLMTACSQARIGISKTGANDELWKAQPLCQNRTGLTVLGCFQIQLDITANVAELYVSALGFNPAQIPFRVLARKQGDSLFYLLADNLTTAVGGVAEIQSSNGTSIQDYQEWRVETTMSFANNIDLSPASPGMGTPVAQVIINWPELLTQ